MRATMYWIAISPQNYALGLVFDLALYSCYCFVFRWHDNDGMFSVVEVLYFAAYENIFTF